LANAEYYGTLAAVRCLGRAGVPIVIADPKWLTPAGWSRFVSRRLRSPSPDEPDQFIDWLLDFGRKNPGHVLYPTSDEMAWLLSAYRDDLAPLFHLYQPSFHTLDSLLDKRKLQALCEQVGLATPSSYTPSGATEIEAERDLETRVREGTLPLAFPLVIKPSTQVLMRSRAKGAMVHGAAQLIERYQAFREKTNYHPMLSKRAPTAARPMLQAYYKEAANGIYTISGFVNDSGVVTALAARKILQRPRNLGIGLCFEAADLDPQLLKGIEKLCRKVNYFGVLEAEFIEVAGRFLLIDFNPRFYGQMAFECDRGLLLPLLAYHAALGYRDSIRPLVKQRIADCSATRAHPTAYTHRLNFEIVTRGQRVTGRMSPRDARAWRDWYRSHRDRMSYAVADRRDRVPAFIDLFNVLRGCLRHPRSFVRTMLLNR